MDIRSCLRDRRDRVSKRQQTPLLQLDRKIDLPRRTPEVRTPLPAVRPAPWGSAVGSQHAGEAPRVPCSRRHRASGRRRSGTGAEIETMIGGDDMSELDVLASVTCSSTRHPGVGRFRRVPGGLELIGVSRQRPGTVLPESSGLPVAGGISTGDGYAGCPSCRADSIVGCNVCSQLGCWDRSWELFQCPTCGNSGPVRGQINEISLLGGG